MRNERRIRNNDTMEHKVMDSEIHNRWKKAINKRLTIDQVLTNSRFGKWALEKKPVRGTWKRCLTREEELPEDWTSIKGVLVGSAASA